jgi:hypothetical protein
MFSKIEMNRFFATVKQNKIRYSIEYSEESVFPYSFSFDGTFQDSYTSFDGMLHGIAIHVAANCGKPETKPAIETDNGIHYDTDGTIQLLGAHVSKPCTIGKALELVSNPVEWLARYLAVHPISIDIVSGDALVDVFMDARPGSCMGKRYAKPWLGIYANNPETVRIATWSRAHPAIELDGSCLVWIGSDSIRVDRMYLGSTCHATMAEHIRNAVERTMLSMFADHVIVPCCDKASFKLAFHNDLMPYCDSFRYAELIGDDTVKLSNRQFGDCHTCQCTEGTDLEQDQYDYHCCSCNCGIVSDDGDYRVTDYGDVYCDDCYNDAFSYCELNDSEYPSDEVSSVTIIDSRGRERHVSASTAALNEDYQEYSGDAYNVDYIHSDYAIETVCGSYIHCDECQANGDESDCDLEWILDDDNVAHPVCNMVWSLDDSCYVVASTL